MYVCNTLRIRSQDYIFIPAQSLRLLQYLYVVCTDTQIQLQTIDDVPLPILMEQDRRTSRRYGSPQVTLDIKGECLPPLSYRAISAVRSFNSIARLATEPGTH